jgi:hypothetical protein
MKRLSIRKRTQRNVLVSGHGWRHQSESRAAAELDRARRPIAGRQCRRARTNQALSVPAGHSGGDRRPRDRARHRHQERARRLARVFKPDLEAMFVVNRKIVGTAIGRDVGTALARFGFDGSPSRARRRGRWWQHEVDDIGKHGGQDRRGCRRWNYHREAACSTGPERVGAPSARDRKCPAQRPTQPPRARRASRDLCPKPEPPAQEV